MFVDSFDHFTSIERLSDQNEFVCRECSKRTEATKKISFEVLPDVLILQLKRFRWSNTSRGKIDHYISFPLQDLDLTPYLMSASVSV